MAIATTMSDSLDASLAMPQNESAFHHVSSNFTVRMGAVKKLDHEPPQ